MTKSQFLEILRAVVTYRVTKKTVPCRCIGCCNEKQKRQGKTEGAVSKAI